MLQLNFSELQSNNILFPLNFDLGEIVIVWRYFYCRWPGNQKTRSALMPVEGLFLVLASIQGLIIVKTLRRNETAKIKTVRKKPLRPLMWLGRSCAIKLRKARCFVTTR